MISLHHNRSQLSAKPAESFVASVREVLGVPWNCGLSVPRRLPDSGLLAAIRSQDFTEYSDRELRDTIDGLRQRTQRAQSEEVLPVVFGIVAEAINRRLGAWRIFGASVDDPRLKNCQTIATQILQSSDHRTSIDRNIYEGPWAEDGPPSSGSSKALGGLPAEVDLDIDKQTIVESIVYVAEASQIRYRPNILLPAGLYQALARVDHGGVLGFHVTDEQILAGIRLYRGGIVELHSGEGKTVAAAFPAVLQAMSGSSVHVITANDYLAARDSELLSPVYGALGLTGDVVLSHLSDDERRDAYAKQIVYGTLREFGFDFLRDNLKSTQGERVQRHLEVVVVDEADHALIDEANTPMIIGGAPSGTRRAFARVRNTVEELIALQSEVALELTEQLHRSTQSHLLLAKLLLAQPDNAALRQTFADDPGCHERVRAIIDRDRLDYPDSVLTTDLLYAVDPQMRFVTLTERGQDFLESRLGRFFEAESTERQLASVELSTDIPLAERRKVSARLARQLARQYDLGNQIYQMLRAYLLLKSDVDYLVNENSIVLIDRYTGRPRPDSRYQQGLQSALEAKEGVTVHPECEVLAQISVQGFISQYRMISGMTGTALGSSEEFQQAYGLNVHVIPPNQPSRRVDLPHRIYAMRQDKLTAVADEVEFCHRVGRPVLIATLTIDQSEEISHLLTKRGVPHNLLNAVSCHDEARIVREAGSFGAVTVATNMAGRGTDIILQPDLTSLICGRYRDLVQRLLYQEPGCVALRCHTKEEADILWAELSGCGTFSLAKQRDASFESILVASGESKATDARLVSLDFGLGLYVIGTELNRSARIDLQLKGRCGRQGEFGWSRFSLSLEDHLFASQAAGALCSAAAKSAGPSGPASYPEHGDVRHKLDRVQEGVEREAEAQRSLVRDYAAALDSQTLRYYRTRREVMDALAFRDDCLRFARERARTVVSQYFPEEFMGGYGLRFDRMVEELQEDYGIDCSGLIGSDTDRLIERAGDMLVEQLESTESRFGEQRFVELAKLLFLKTGDELWRDHFCELQELMSTIQQAGYGHHFALAEYVLQASKRWRPFRQETIALFLSRLLSFPTDEVAGQPAPVLEGHVFENDLAEDIALVLV